MDAKPQLDFLLCTAHAVLLQRVCQTKLAHYPSNRERLMWSGNILKWERQQLFPAAKVINLLVTKV